MTAPLTFVDTNILVYAHDASDGERHARASSLLTRLWSDRSGVVSTQVLTEFFQVATRKLGMASADAREVVLLYAAWPVVEIDVPMLVAAMERHQRDAIAWWDCLIIEAALCSGAEALASEDFQRGRRFGPLAVMNPFA